MTAFRNMGLRAACLASTAIIVVALGCDDGTGLGKRYSVSGMVLYKSQPVEKGTISFTPTTPDGRAATGTIENGKYSLTTLAPGDGALPGKYKVTVIAKEVDTTEMEKISKGGQFHHDATFFKAMKNAKKLVPAKYGLADTSGLEREVKTSSNTLDFELTD